MPPRQVHWPALVVGRVLALHCEPAQDTDWPEEIYLHEDSVMATTLFSKQLTQKWQGRPSWLRRKYQQWALRQAISRTYTSFARQNWEWVDYLFDEPFLTRRAFPLLARSLEGNAWPAPIELAGVWAEQFTWFSETMKQHHMAKLIPVASHFLRMLKMELSA